MPKLIRLLSSEVYIEEDEYEHGCKPGTGRWGGSTNYNKSFPNLLSLLEFCSKEFYLPKTWQDYVIDEDQTAIRYQRLEDSESNELLPATPKWEEWMRGEIKGYLVDYTWNIEIIMSEPAKLTEKELDAVGIQKE